MAPPDKKRKKEKDDKKTTPAKKRKLDTKSKSKAVDKKSKATSKPKTGVKSSAAKKVTATKKVTAAKKIAASKVKKVIASKAKKPEPKGKKAAANVGKKPVKGKEVTKKGSQSKPTPKKEKVTKKDTKKVVKKVVVSKPVKKLAPKSVTRSKIEKKPVQKSKAQITASKAKAKALQNLAKKKSTNAKLKQLPSKQKLQNGKAVAAKVQNKNAKNISKAATQSKKENGKNKTAKPEPKSTKTENQTNPKTADTKKGNPSSSENDKKRKNPSSESDSTDIPRKRRIITPNKKYADFEVGTPSKNVSELRAFLQDKKKATDAKSTPKASTDKKKRTDTKSTPKTSTDKKKATDTKSTPKTSTDKKKATDTKSTPKASTDKTTTSLKDKAKTKKTAEKPLQKPLLEDIKLKVIKPSEMKPADKLLKKLQKKLEKEAKAASVLKPKTDKPKVTKVITYHKPAALKAKPPLLMQKAKAALKQQQGKLVKKVKQNASMPPKASPKVAQSPEKAKPRKMKEVKKEDRQIQAHFVHQKYIREQNDTSQECWITGMEVFPSGEIVVVDMANKKIKLYTENFSILNQIKLDTIPQDISISPIDASRAYFTKPFSKEGIQKISMSDGLISLKESFWTNGTNRGITCTKAGILTSVQDGRYHDLDINCFKIDLLDYEGKVLQSVSTDQSGMRLFKLPLYFVVNSTGKQIIVSDCIRNNSYVVSLDMTGKIKFKFTGFRDYLITPRGLTVDDEDNIYVTDWDGNNVYVLSPTGKRLQVLVDEKELKEEGLEGLQKPYQLCYYKSDKGGKLIVSQERCNTVKVFNIVKKGAEGAQAEAVGEKPQETPKLQETPKSSEKS